MQTMRFDNSHHNEALRSYSAIMCDLGPRGDEVIDEDLLRVVARVVLSERAELRRARGRA